MSFKKESCTGKVKEQSDFFDPMNVTEKDHKMPISRVNQKYDSESIGYTTPQKNIVTGRIHTYRIDDRKILGRGAFSTVYSGTNLTTNDKVAIKKISLNKLTNKEIDVVDREIKIVTKLIDMANPYKNIVTYYDVIKSSTTMYIVMELCPDGTLASLLVKPMKEKFSRYYFKQILDSLKALQELSIVHKDIKPDNILIFNDYKTLKICDFGFSQEFRELDSTTQHICGSPIYMAPESFHLKNIKTNSSAKALPIPLPHSHLKINTKMDRYIGLPPNPKIGRTKRKNDDTTEFVADDHIDDLGDDDLDNYHTDHSHDDDDDLNDDLSYLNLNHTNSDLWSAGMIFYEMVYGYHPHRGSKDVHTIKKTLLKSIRVVEMPWTDLGHDGFQLMRDILDANSVSRITVDNVMKHPWIRMNDEPVKKIVLSELFHLSDLRFISRSLPKTLEFDRYMQNNPTNRHKSMYASNNGEQIDDNDIECDESPKTKTITRSNTDVNINLTKKSGDNALHSASHSALNSKYTLRLNNRYKDTDKSAKKRAIAKDDISLIGSSTGTLSNSPSPDSSPDKLSFDTDTGIHITVTDVNCEKNTHTNQIINNGAFDAIIKMHNQKVYEKKSVDEKCIGAKFITQTDRCNSDLDCDEYDNTCHEEMFKME